MVKLTALLRAKIIGLCDPAKAKPANPLHPLNRLELTWFIRLFKNQLLMHNYPNQTLIFPALPVFK
jgi:hypothetical protein